MSLFMNNKGNISLFRVGLLLAGLGVLVIAGGFILFNLEEAQRESPFNVDLYPGAVEWSRQDIRSTARILIYEVPNTTPEQVLEFYQQELDDHLDQNPNNPNREMCQRVPAVGVFPDYDEGSGNLPYFYRCVFENSTFTSTQFTVVTIEPGVRLDEGERPYNNEGNTFIEYEQVWSS
jgi:hypothetical protein